MMRSKANPLGDGRRRQGTGCSWDFLCPVAGLGLSSTVMFSALFSSWGTSLARVTLARDQGGGSVYSLRMLFTYSLQRHGLHMWEEDRICGISPVTKSSGTVWRAHWSLHLCLALAVSRGTRAGLASFSHDDNHSDHQASFCTLRAGSPCSWLRCCGHTPALLGRVSWSHSSQSLWSPPSSNELKSSRAQVKLVACRKLAQESAPPKGSHLDTISELKN